MRMLAMKSSRTTSNFSFVSERTAYKETRENTQGHMEHACHGDANAGRMYKVNEHFLESDQQGEAESDLNHMNDSPDELRVNPLLVDLHALCTNCLMAKNWPHADRQNPIQRWIGRRNVVHLLERERDKNEQVTAFEGNHNENAIAW
jgi:hypothetical protein